MTYNVSTKALATAHVLRRSTGHDPVENGTPEQHRAWCAEQLVAAHERGEKLQGLAIKFFRADHACLRPLYAARNDQPAVPQLSLELSL